VISPRDPHRHSLFTSKPEREKPIIPPRAEESHLRVGASVGWYYKAEIWSVVILASWLSVKYGTWVLVKKPICVVDSAPI
jgi:hypothetical protein